MAKGTHELHILPKGTKGNAVPAPTSDVPSKDVCRILQERGGQFYNPGMGYPSHSFDRETVVSAGYLRVSREFRVGKMTNRLTSQFSNEIRSLRYVSIPSVFGTILRSPQNESNLSYSQGIPKPYFCPKKSGFVFVALHFMPS